MIETKGVVHCTIAVSDPEKSEAFYRDVLGLKVVQKVMSVGSSNKRHGTKSSTGGSISRISAGRHDAVLQLRKQCLG